MGPSDPCARRSRSSAAGSRAGRSRRGPAPTAAAAPRPCPGRTCTIRGSPLCCTTPATMSPSRPRNSPSTCSSSASRSRCMIVCRAVAAAIRPKPSGVSSHSRTGRPASSSSAAQTTTCPLLRSSSTRASGLRAVGAVVGQQQRLLDRAHQQVERDLLLPLQRAQRRHVDVHPLTPAPHRPVPPAAPSGPSAPSGRENSTWTWPADELLPAHRRGDAGQHDAGLVDAVQPALRLGPVPQHGADQPATGAQPVPPLGQRTVHAGRADLQHVRPVGQHIRPRRRRPRSPGTRRPRHPGPPSRPRRPAGPPPRGPRCGARPG